MMRTRVIVGRCNARATQQPLPFGVNRFPKLVNCKVYDDTQEYERELRAARVTRGGHGAVPPVAAYPHSTPMRGSSGRRRRGLVLVEDVPMLNHSADAVCPLGPRQVEDLLQRAVLPKGPRYVPSRRLGTMGDPGKGRAAPFAALPQQLFRGPAATALGQDSIASTAMSLTAHTDTRLRQRRSVLRGDAPAYIPGVGWAGNFA